MFFWYECVLCKEDIEECEKWKSINSIGKCIGCNVDFEIRWSYIHHKSWNMRVFDVYVSRMEENVWMVSVCGCAGIVGTKEQVIIKYRPSDREENLNELMWSK